MAVLQKYDWIIALISIAFCCSSFGNGANDVANSYATSVAARTLTMPQVGFLSMITEFVGAVALGSRVTGTIKNDIMDIDRFEPRPGVLMLAMGCAEIASAAWLLISTGSGFPVSTTQTIVGALVGVGIASQASVSWGWADGSVSQIAASWAIAPMLAAAFSAILYLTLKFAILERTNAFEWAMRLIPFYLAFTAAVLALFITIEAPTADSLEELGAGTVCGIILGVFFGVLLIAYVFFKPYFYRRLIMQDARVRSWHIPLGPILYREDLPLYWPGNAEDGYVIDYYFDPHKMSTGTSPSLPTSEKDTPHNTSTPTSAPLPTPEKNPPDLLPTVESSRGEATTGPIAPQAIRGVKIHPEPEERFLSPTVHLPIHHPQRLLSWIKYLFLQGVTRDCVTHSSAHLQAIHSRAKAYDNRVEHLWTYAQVASAMMMSIAHGSNDVANAVGPWVAAYNTYKSGMVNEDSDTPVWILVIAGFLLGAGFWFYGYHIIRALGNRITRMSPTRGYSMELGAAITVLIASRLGLPVSTTQCLTGATMGVALMNFDIGAVNWRQLAFIFCGWVLTLPVAGLFSGLLMGMALNTPHF